MRAKHTGLAVVGLAAAIAACTTGANDDGVASGESANTEAIAPILAPTWTKCWVEKDTSTTDAFFQAHYVKCRYDVPDAKQPIKPSYVTVEVHDARGGAEYKELDETPGQDVVIRRVGNEYFPLKVYAHVSSDDFEALGLERGGLIDARLTIANADAATAEHPLEIKQPFDIWPLMIIQKASFFSLRIDRHAISIAPFVFGQAVDAPSDGFASGLAMGREANTTKKYFFIAPKDGGLTATYHGDADVPGVRIDGPGYYVADEAELRKATEEEASSVAPNPPPAPQAGDAAAPEPVVSDAAASADASSSPPRECGVEGKKCCGGSNGYGGTCDPGTFCPSGSNTCVACGGENQKCCGGPNDNGYGGTCGAGMFCPTGNNVCVACGDPSEKCCGGPNNNGYGGTCNTGAFCFTGNNVCVSCGKPGEKCCGGPNANGYGGTCDPGATCKAGNNVCVANN